MNEIFENHLSTGGVRTSGWKLEAVNPSLDISDGRVGRVLRPDQGAKAFGKFGDLVSVTIPNVEFRGKATEEIGSPVYLQLPRTILTLRERSTLPTKIKGQKLQAVANPEIGTSQVVNTLVEHGALDA